MLPMVFICDFIAMSIDTFLTIGMMLGPFPPEFFAGQIPSTLLRFRNWFRKPADSITADFLRVLIGNVYLHQK